jgi:glycosyltransferase involved in cell wall biosynthesis
MNLSLLIYSRSWSPEVGGVETITRTLAEGLSKRPYSQTGDSVRVVLVTLTPAGGMDDSLLPFQVVRRPKFWHFIQLCRTADIVHLAGPALLPLSLGWLLRKRIVLEHHNYQSMCPNGLLIHRPDLAICPNHFLAGRYEECYRCNSEALGRAASLRNLLLAFPRRWLAKNVAANVAPSCHMKTRAALPRTQVIYHGVAHVNSGLETMSKRTTRTACFAFVGRLVREKGVSLLLYATEQLIAEGYDVRIKILGDGPDRARLEALAKDLHLQTNTEFIGAVPIELISEVLSEAIAVVMPSTWEDVAPMVAIEQMMQGRLVIASDVGGLGETINGFGLKFPPGDIGALKSCMRQAAENPGLSVRMGREARTNAITSFSQERMVEEHFQLYRRIIEPDALPK